MDLANTIQILTITFSAITLVFLLYQSKVQTTTTKNQIYQNFVNNSLEIDRMFVAHPEFRAYIYGNKEIKPEEVDIELLMSRPNLLSMQLRTSMFSRMTSLRIVDMDG